MCADRWKVAATSSSATLSVALRTSSGSEVSFTTGFRLCSHFCGYSVDAHTVESFTLENMPPASLSSTLLVLVTAAMVPITATMPTAAMTLATATLLAMADDHVNGKRGVE